MHRPVDECAVAAVDIVFPARKAAVFGLIGNDGAAVAAGLFYPDEVTITVYSWRAAGELKYLIPCQVCKISCGGSIEAGFDIPSFL
jgi:hypothetical protein